MNRKVYVTLCHLLMTITMLSQIDVITVIDDIRASGGVTAGPDGTFVISDFGKALNSQGESTRAVLYRPGAGVVEEFGSGFKGASGAAFDADGVFFQSNPKGNMISRRDEDGVWQLDWISEGLKIPIGIAADNKRHIFVCNCGANNIVRINTETAVLDTFAASSLFNCPNGLTRDFFGNLFACNFNDGRVLKINPWGEVEVWAELPVLSGGPTPVGNGHLTWANGNLIVTMIGTGEIYLVKGKDDVHKICGISAAFTNIDGDATTATFSKPNGIASTSSGDTLYINCSTPSWQYAAMDLHPAPLRQIRGVCEVAIAECWTSDYREAVEQIMERTKSFSEAYKAMAYDELVSAYTIDGKIMPNGTKIITGRDEIRKRWILPQGSKVLQHKVYHEQIKVLEDIAYDYGYYEGATMNGEGKVETWKGKYVIIWKKQEEEWKIYVDIWNRVI